MIRHPGISAFTTRFIPSPCTLPAELHVEPHFGPLKLLNLVHKALQQPLISFLAGAFAEQAEAIKGLAAPVLRGLAQVLTHAASGITEGQHLHSYVSFVFSGVSGVHAHLRARPSGEFFMRCA